MASRTGVIGRSAVDVAARPATRAVKAVPQVKPDESASKAANILAGVWIAIVTTVVLGGLVALFIELT